MGRTAERTRLHFWVSHIEIHTTHVLMDCSSSNAMPKEVRASIAWCLSADGAGTMTDEEAGTFVEEMFEDGRGGEESW